MGTSVAIGYDNVAADQFVVTADSTPPTVEVMTDAPATVTGDFDITVTFSESVQDFVEADLQAAVTNGTVSNFDATAEPDYTATITPTADETVTVDIPANVATDLASNPNTAQATPFTRTADLGAPTVEVTSATTGTVTGAFDITITFSRAVRNFDQADLDGAVTNGTVSAFGTTSDSVYTATITPTPSVNTTVTVLIPAEAAEDLSGTLSAAQATPYPRPVIVSDLDVAITAPAFTNADPFPITITFSEAVDGFDEGDITVGGDPSTDGTTLAALESSSEPDEVNQEFTVAVTPGGEGAITFDIMAGVVTATAVSELSNQAATQATTTYDATRPSVTFDVPTAVNAAFPATITFSEVVSDFGESVLMVTGGEAAPTTATTAGQVFTSVITPSAGVTEVVISIAENAVTDGASNGNTAGSVTVAVDTVVPIVTLTTVPASPVNEDFVLHMVFDEVVTGLAADDITADSGATVDASSFAAAPNGTDYSVTIEVPTTDATVEIAVAEDAAMDGVGNRNAETTLSVTVDHTQPTVTAMTTETAPVTGEFDLTLTFSEPVQGLAAEDFGVVNARIGAIDEEQPTATFVVPVTPTASGEITVDLQADRVADVAGNGNVVMTQFTMQANLATLQTTLSLEDGPTVGAAFNVRIVFATAVTGFAQDDVTVDGPADIVALTPSAVSGEENQVWNLGLQATGDGAITISIAANRVDDADTTTGRTNQASNDLSVTPDRTAPTVEFVTPPTATNADIPLTIRFSETVTGFTDSDIELSDTTAMIDDFTMVTEGREYTSTVTLPSEDGDLTITIPDMAVQDVVGLPNAATSITVAVDRVAPVVTITPASRVFLVNADFGITIEFSESVVQFEENMIDVTPTGATGAGLTDFTAVTTGDAAGRSYTATITLPDVDGQVTVGVAAGAVMDAAGNRNADLAQHQVTSDTVPPTVTIAAAMGTPDPVTAPFVLEVTFSEKVFGLVDSEVVISNGVGRNLVETSSGTAPSVFTLDVTPSANGTVTVGIAGDVAEDAAGNGNAAATDFTVTAALSGPTVVIDSATTSPTNEDSFTVTITFSEAVSGFEDADLDVTNGAASGTAVSGGGTEPATSFTSTITPGADGEVTISIAADAAMTATNVGNTAAAPFSITVDRVNPTVSLTPTRGNLVNDAFVVRVVFSEPVTGFAVGDIRVTGGAVGPVFFTAPGEVFDVTINPTAEGEVTIDLAADAVQDAASNGNDVAPQLSVTVDQTAPTVSLVPERSHTSTAFDVTVTFSEIVRGFELADVDVVGGTADSFTGDRPGSTFVVTITPTVEGTVTIDIGADSVQDLATNGNAAATQATVIYDATAPVVEFVNPPTATNANIPLTIRFNKAVTGFTESDIELSDATAMIDEFMEVMEGREYTATVTLPTDDGDLTITIPAMAVQDVVNLPNAATSITVAIDRAAPVVTITPATTATAVNANFGITIAFDEPVVQFDDTLIDVTPTGAMGATITDFATVTAGREYTATVTLPDADEMVTVSIAADAVMDTAGNGNAAAAQYQVTADRARPTVSMAIDPVATMVDGPFVLVITFSEKVFELMDSEVVITSGVGRNLAETSTGNDPSVFRMDVTPTASGTVTVRLAANVADDAAGNGNTAATDFTVTAELTKPTVIISSTTSSPTNENTFVVTITFSEEVSGLTNSEVVVTNGAASGTAVSGGGMEPATTFTSTITPEADGEVTINIAEDVAMTATNEGNSAAAQFAITVDRMLPTVSLAPERSHVNSAFDVTVTLSENVSGFAVEDVMVVGGTVESFTGDQPGSVFVVTITPTVEGAVTIDIGTDAVQDAATNGNAAATQATVTFDETAPTVTLAPEGSHANAAFDVTATFSEMVSGFAVEDVMVDGGTADSFTGEQPGSTFVVTITPTVEGEVTIDIGAGAVQDAATNGNDAATPATVTFDETAPTVMLAPERTHTNAAFDVTVTFSENVSGFAVGDVMVVGGTVDSFTGDQPGSTFVVTITPTDEGAVTIDIGTDVVQDAATNGNAAAAQATVTFDETPPTVTIVDDTTIPAFVGATFDVVVEFDNPVSEFASADLTVVNGTAAAPRDQGDQTTFEVTITPTADGEVSVMVGVGEVSDLATNPNTAASNTLTRTAVLTVPNAPTNLMAEGGQGLITLNWQAPDPTGGGGTVAGYRIDSSPDGTAGSWQTLVGNTGTMETTYRHSGLAGDQTVHYRVFAVNLAGASTDSVAASATTVMSGEVDVDGDNTVTASDAIILYNALALDTLLGDGDEEQGIPTFQDSFLGPYRPAGMSYQELLSEANRLADVATNPGLDVNETGTIDEADALLIYFVLSLPELIGDGSAASGFEQYRRVFMRPYLGAGAQDDAEMRRLIDVIRNLQP